MAELVDALDLGSNALRRKGSSPFTLTKRKDFRFFDRKSFSRFLKFFLKNYDIEMKTVYYVVATTEGGELTYTVVETEIPMLFVQKKNVEEFSSDVLDKNDDAFDTTPELPAEELGVAEENFESINEALTEIKEKLTYEELESQLGTRDPFFG